MAATAQIELEFPLMRYETTRALLDGRVGIEGVALRPAPTPPVIYDDIPDLREGNFGLCDLNIGYFLPAIEAGWEIVGIPVFTMRKPIHQFIFCRADRGIERPVDLQGKVIATRTYRTAFTIWARGFLRHRHGVDVSAVRWATQMNEVFPIYDEAVDRAPSAEPGKHPLESVLDGDVDAAIAGVITTRDFKRLEASPVVRRLFPDYMGVDQQVLRETAIYPPVRLIVMSKKLDRSHPDLARKVYDAFDQAKTIAYDEMLSDRAGSVLTYLRERLEEQLATMGDLFAYGVAANRPMIDTFIRFNHEQGLIRAPIAYDQIFAASSLDT